MFLPSIITLNKMAIIYHHLQANCSSLEQLKRIEKLVLLMLFRRKCPQMFLIFSANKMLFVLGLCVIVFILTSLKSNNLGIYFRNPFHLKRELSYLQQSESMCQAFLFIFTYIFVFYIHSSLPLSFSFAEMTAYHECSYETLKKNP